MEEITLTNLAKQYLEEDGESFEQQKEEQDGMFEELKTICPDLYTVLKKSKLIEKFDKLQFFYMIEDEYIEEIKNTNPHDYDSEPKYKTKFKYAKFRFVRYEDGLNIDFMSTLYTASSYNDMKAFIKRLYQELYY